MDALRKSVEAERSGSAATAKPKAVSNRGGAVLSRATAKRHRHPSAACSASGQHGLEIVVDATLTSNQPRDGTLFSLRQHSR